jgi:hypothetical protein
MDSNFGFRGAFAPSTVRSRGYRLVWRWAAAGRMAAPDVQAFKGYAAFHRVPESREF